MSKANIIYILLAGQIKLSVDEENSQQFDSEDEVSVSGKYSEF